MNKKLIFAVIAVVLIAGAVTVTYFINRPDSDNTSQSQTENQPDVDGKIVTRTGVFGCLVPSGDGPHTMECTLGLIMEDGTQYALTADDTGMLAKLPTNQPVKITGVLSKQSDQASKYKTAGTIRATSVKVL